MKTVLKKVIAISYFFLGALSVLSMNRPGQANDIDFNYQSTRVADKSQRLLKVECSLLNNTSDTIYFLTTTCNGYRYSLRYNEQNFELYEMIRCRNSDTYVQELSPGIPLSFVCYLREVEKNVVIKLGFDLYKVESNSLFVDTMRYSIFNRKLEDQEVIWGDSVRIDNL
ncbi:hypothetical protein [Croceimicrobium sp.]|uniref:hypothetical protein n=1 Tax=Croceimicrobium sp. TaxID=2828340 RepID=UPI003BAA9AF4